MGRLGTFVVVGFTVLGIACGGSSSSGNDGGTGGTVGTGGVLGTGGGGGNGGSGGGTGSGSCNAPSCLNGLMTSCEPSGTCVSQMDMTTFASNTCYSNGVKELMAISASGMTMTVKKDSSTCYSVDVSATGVLTFKNGAGSPVATGTYDKNAGTTTVTCTGGQPVTLNASCDTADMGGAMTGGSDCTDGVCTP